MLRAVSRISWLAVLALFIPACTENESPSAPPEPRLVLLYANCTLNRDFLSPYNPEVRYTPHLAAFAERSAVFTRHQTESGQSSVSFASLFSGTQSNRHGIYTNPQRLSQGVRLIAEVFRDGGYEASTWLNHGMASARLGYAQGGEPRNRASMLTADSPGFVAALEKLRSNPGAKAFLLANHTVTHGPYRVERLERFCALYPEPCEGVIDRPSFARLRELYQANHIRLSFDFDVAVKKLGLTPDDVAALAEVLELLYKANVFHLDELFGGIVDRIAAAGLLDESVIAFTTDHGEVLYRENAVFQWSHSLQLAREVLQVPFLLYGPVVGVRPGRYERVTRSVDVLPTLAGLVGIELDEGGLAGVDLSPTLRGERPAPALLAFSHTSIAPRFVIEKMGSWEGVRRTHPRAEAELMWVAVRRGDTVYKVRQLEGQPPRCRSTTGRATPGKPGTFTTRQIPSTAA